MAGNDSSECKDPCMYAFLRCLEIGEVSINLGKKDITVEIVSLKGDADFCLTDAADVLEDTDEAVCNALCEVCTELLEQAKEEGALRHTTPWF